MAVSTALKEKYSAHIADDVEYPATCSDLVSACNNMSEFSQEEKDWFSKTLPHGTFNNADEVTKAL
jgi:hypothetical protein